MPIVTLMPYCVKVNLIGLLLRIFSFVYHLPLALFFLGIGLFGLVDGAGNMRYELLPWTGRELVYWLTGLGFAGVMSILLALSGKNRLLFVLYALVMFGLMANAFQSRYYGGMEAFKSMAWITFGALGALVGAIGNARR